MLVFDGIIYSLQSFGGITVYFDSLVKNYSGDYLLCNYGKKRGVEKESYKQKRYMERVRRFDDPILDAEDIVFHSSYYRVPSQNKGAKVITTVHDFTHQIYFNFPNKHINTLVKKRALLESDKIICISENTKKDLFKFFPVVDENKVSVIYNGVGKDFRVLKKREGKNYLIYVGSRFGYKNFLAVVKSLEYHRDLRLYIVGGGSLRKEEKSALEKILPGRYKKFDSVSSEYLNELYNNAFCFIYPSLYEGFGIPVIEAMRAGCPVIANNNSSIPEVSGDAALLTDNGSADEISEMIFYLKNKADIRKIVSAGLENAKRFSWEKCAEETYSIYKELM